MESSRKDAVMLFCFLVFFAYFSLKLTRNSKSCKAQLTHLEQKDVKYIHGSMGKCCLYKIRKKMWKREKKGSSRVTAPLTHEAVTPYGSTDTGRRSNGVKDRAEQVVMGLYPYVISSFM